MVHSVVTFTMADEDEPAAKKTKTNEAAECTTGTTFHSLSFYHDLYVTFTLLINVLVGEKKSSV